MDQEGGGPAFYSQLTNILDKKWISGSFSEMVCDNKLPFS